MRSCATMIASLAFFVSVDAACGQAKKDNQTSADQVSFDRDIQPILTNSCTRCHGATKAKAGLQLDTLEHTLAGSSYGPVVVFGKSTESLLVKKTDPDDSTPHKGVTLGKKELGLVKAWINQGDPAGKTSVPKAKDKAKPSKEKADLEKRIDQLIREIEELQREIPK